MQGSTKDASDPWKHFPCGSCHKRSKAILTRSPGIHRQSIGAETGHSDPI